jgi:hypothetical protein
MKKEDRLICYMCYVKTIKNYIKILIIAKDKNEAKIKLKKMLKGMDCRYINYHLEEI